jgi:tetratricopeptide (TPR) repeat protein
LFSLEDEITRQIAAALNAGLIVAEAARSTERPDVLDYILRGRAAQLGPRTPEARAQAIALFERALSLDPDSLEARIKLAEALANRALAGMRGSRASDIPRAEMLIGQALEASPGDSHAHLVKASVLRAQGRCAEAVPEYEAVIASDGNRASAYAGLGTCKLLTGSIDETIPLEEEAIRLSPRDPTSASGIGGSGSRICSNRTPTKRSSGSKRRLSPFPDIQSITPGSPQHMG